MSTQPSTPIDAKMVAIGAVQDQTIEKLKRTFDSFDDDTKYAIMLAYTDAMLVLGPEEGGNLTNRAVHALAYSKGITDHEKHMESMMQCLEVVAILYDSVADLRERGLVTTTTTTTTRERDTIMFDKNELEYIHEALLLQAAIADEALRDETISSAERADWETFDADVKALIKKVEELV